MPAVERSIRPSSKQAVQEYFDHDVEGYQGAYAAGATGARAEIFQERRQAALTLLRDPVGRVLDIGSGPGVLTQTLLDRGGECWVVDLSPRMVEASRRQLAADPRARRVRHGVADIERLSFGDGAFDSIVCLGVLQYLETPAAALREMARVTRVGGQVVVSFPSRRSPLNTLHRGVVAVVRGGRWLLGRLGVRWRSAPGRLTFRTDIPSHFYTVSEIEAIARTVGLQPQERVAHSAHFPFPVPGCGPLLRAWDRWANGALRRGRLRGWGREVVLRCRRAG